MKTSSQQVTFTYTRSSFQSLPLLLHLPLPPFFTSTSSLPPSLHWFNFRYFQQYWSVSSTMISRNSAFARTITIEKRMCLPGVIWIKISDPRSLVHGVSKEPRNPWPEWIHEFLWCTMIRAIFDQWSWSMPKGPTQKTQNREWPCNQMSFREGTANKKQT